MGNYTAHLDGALSRLHEEGRYRTFIDIERDKGNFPHASWNCPDGSKKPIVVWCGNDYLGMGQHPVVLNAMHGCNWCRVWWDAQHFRDNCLS